MQNKIVVDLSTLPDLIKLIQENKFNKKPTSTSLLIDFSPNTYFLRPYQIVSLSCLIEEYHLNGCSVLLNPAQNRVHDYLNNIKFYNYWRPGFARTSFTQTKNTTLCLWKISKGMINSYATYAQNFFENNYFSGKSLSPLNIALAEVFNNIYDHSKSFVDGYVLTQYYPNLAEIVISICDFGLGIPTTLNAAYYEKHGYTFTDPHAIMEALKKSVSAKSQPNNKGFGLDNISSIVRSHRGILKIFSNKGLLIQRPDGSILTQTLFNRFPGTLVDIILNTKYLPEIEQELADFDLSL